jgi:hypothetical protein
LDFCVEREHASSPISGRSSHLHSKIELHECEGVRMFGFSALQILLGLINILCVADLNYLCIESVNTNCARETFALIPTFNELHSTAFVFYNSLQELNPMHNPSNLFREF